MIRDAATKALEDASVVQSSQFFFGIPIAPTPPIAFRPNIHIVFAFGIIKIYRLIV
jgi:hypothetical protein